MPAGWAYGSTYLKTEGFTRFVLYAPGADSVSLSGSFNDWGATEMERSGDNFWIEIEGAGPGDPYKYRSLSFEGEWIADPCSLFITNDSYGNSIIVDPAGLNAAHNWSDGSWSRPDRDELVIYEMHVIDFTWNNRSGPAPGVEPGHQGTFAGVADRSDYLADLGINAVELMPVQEWPGGSYSWGYNPYLFLALESSLGTGDGSSVIKEFKEMVDTLHQKGIAVILDVVYNHTTGDSPLYKINKDQFFDGDTPWGPKLDLTDDYVFNHVRESLIHFMDEYHVDGFRFDSTENIDGEALRDLVTELSDSGYDSHYYIFEEFNGVHNAAIQSYNSLYGYARISSWGTGFKEGLFSALNDSYYGSLGDITYHSNSYGFTFSDSAITYGSSHDEGTLFYHSGLKSRLTLTALTHELTSLGLPMIWMGDEIMRDHRGNNPVSGSGVDELNNQMDWVSLMNSNEDELQFVRDLLALRRNHPSLRRGLSSPDSHPGSFSDGFEWNTDWESGFLGYVLGEQGDRPFAIFINYGNSSRTFNAFFPEDGSWTPVLDSSQPKVLETGTGPALEVASGNSEITVPADGALIYAGPVNL